MSEVYFDSQECGHAQVEVDFFRRYELEPSAMAPYLLTVGIRPSLHGRDGAYPQSLAVMDDFGTLRIVGRWS